VVGRKGWGTVGVPLPDRGGRCGRKEKGGRVSAAAGRLYHGNDHWASAGDGGKHAISPDPQLLVRVRVRVGCRVRVRIRV